MVKVRVSLVILSFIQQLKITMSDNLTTNVPNRSKNEDFIQAIKDKYSSIPRAAPLPQASQRQLTNALPERTLAVIKSQARLDSGELKDYQTLRRKYEEKEVIPEEGAVSTGKSSPIKRFYQSGKGDYLMARRQQIEQAHLQRANQHRAERELNQRAIANIEQLLATIRSTFSRSSYHSL